MNSDLNKFLTDQTKNALSLLSQHQTIGNTHMLYPQAVINGVIQSLQQVGNALNQPTEPIKSTEPVESE